MRIKLKYRVAEKNNLRISERQTRTDGIFEKIYRQIKAHKKTDDIIK